MQAPKFWQSNSLISKLLYPLSQLYFLIYNSKTSNIEPVVLGVPVICVGNAIVGGAGKTPIVISLVEYYKKQGKNPHIISRGYGGEATILTMVDRDLHNAKQVGDEPLMLAKYAPCWIAKKREIAARAAINAGANIIIMDDGLQNPTLHKNISIMAVDGGYGFGNGKLLPAGPMRESLELAVAKSDIVIISGDDA